MVSFSLCYVTHNLQGKFDPEAATTTDAAFDALHTRNQFARSDTPKI